MDVNSIGQFNAGTEISTSDYTAVGDALYKYVQKVAADPIQREELLAGLRTRKASAWALGNATMNGLAGYMYDAAKAAKDASCTPKDTTADLYSDRTFMSIG